MALQALLQLGLGVGVVVVDGRQLLARAADCGQAEGQGKNQMIALHPLEAVVDQAVVKGLGEVAQCPHQEAGAAHGRVNHPQTHDDLRGPGISTDSRICSPRVLDRSPCILLLSSSH